MTKGPGNRPLFRVLSFKGKAWLRYVPGTNPDAARLKEAPDPLPEAYMKFELAEDKALFEDKWELSRPVEGRARRTHAF